MTEYYHGTLQEVQAACDKVYANMLREKADDGDGTLLINPSANDNKIIAMTATDTELLGVPLLGKKGQDVNLNTGYTTSWDVPKQCYNDPTKYWAHIPRSDLTVGVICSISFFSNDWLVPVGDV